MTACLPAAWHSTLPSISSQFIAALAPPPYPAIQIDAVQAGPAADRTAGQARRRSIACGADACAAALRGEVGGTGRCG